MRRLRLWVGTGLALLPFLHLPLAGTGSETFSPHSQSIPDEGTCAVCHPGALKGLKQSPHAVLLENAATRDKACSSCHGDLSAHQLAKTQAQGTPTTRAPVARVAASACAECHPGTGWAPDRGAHPLRRALSTAASRPAVPEPAAPIAVPAPAPGFLGLDWSSMFATGMRWVDRDGSRDRYKTDLNLDTGFRLSELELQATGRDQPFLDLFRFEARDVADPYQRLRARLEKDGRYDARARFHKNAITYRAAGDFHRVDQKQQETGFDLEVEVTEGLRVFGSFTRGSEDGFWLTNRIGVRNVNPQTTIANVQSPRQWDQDLVEGGLAGRIGAVDWTAAVEHEERTQRDRWSYAQPASRNPAFPESEDFLSRSTLRGPGARASVHVPVDALTLDLKGRVLDRDRRISGAGDQAGFDISDFTTTTSSFSSGDATTWLLDAAATLELSDRVALLVESRWVDHREDLAIRQLEVTRYPTLNTVTTTLTDLVQETRQRTLETSAQLDFEPLAGLKLTAGYGFEREWLKVPDLEAGDNDYRLGQIDTDGLILGAQWRPDAHWTLKAGFRGFGNNGVYLHEIVEDDLREVSGSIGHKRAKWSLEATAKSRRSENDVSRTSLESIVTTATGTLRPSEGFDLFATWTYSDVNARTLTNFYFDPDPAPRPSWVGFQGDTHTITTGLELHPCAKVTWKFDGTYTNTTGSFDVALLDWRADLAVRVTRGGSAGVMVRFVDYEEQAGTDDYDAEILMLYWRQKIGGG